MGHEDPSGTQYGGVMSWWAYVLRTSGTDSPKAMREVTGFEAPTFSKWKSGQQPGPKPVADFARAYGRPVLEAFVAAGFLTPEEAKARPTMAPDYTQLSNDELLELVRQRMGEADGNATTTTRPGGSPGESMSHLQMAARKTGRIGGAGRARQEQDEQGESV